MKKIFLFVFVLSIFLLGCKKDNQTSITVACNMPMTGDFSLYGESVQKGILMAIEENKESNNDVEFDFEDNHSNSKDAVTVFKKQELQGYDIYMSGITQQTAAILPSQKKSQKPHFIWSYSPLVLTSNDNLFRTWVDYPQEANCFLNYLSYHPEFKKIACVYPNAESAQSLFNELFIPNLSNNIEVVYNEAFDVSTSNFKNIVQKIKSSSPDIIFINGWDNHLPGLIKEIVLNGLKKDGNLVFTFDLMDAVPKISADLLEGLVANIPNFEVSHSQKYMEWEKRFQDLYGTTPNYTNAYAYDLANIIVSTALKHKEHPELSLSEILLSTDMDGITGHLHFSQEGMLVGTYITSVYNNSKFVPIEYGNQ